MKIKEYMSHFFWRENHELLVTTKAEITAPNV